MLPISEEIKEVHRRYLELARRLDAEHGLGGQLFYVAPLDQGSTSWLRAANIAGAASLTASADPSILRNAMREGVVDFVVTNLDEAVRILKNEIRKRQTVAVGIQDDPNAVTAEMLARGVQADIAVDQLPPVLSELEWIVMANSAGGQSQGELEGRVMNLLPAGDWISRRWFRLSSRYLGRQFRSVRTLACEPAVAARIREVIAAC